FEQHLYKPHKANDGRWEAIQAVRSHVGVLELKHFKVLKKLGCGHISSVYMSELTSTRTYFAIKVVDKSCMEARKKLLRAKTKERFCSRLIILFYTLYTLILRPTNALVMRLLRSQTSVVNVPNDLFVIAFTQT
ncbi:Protein kinase G11A, partial [Linum grandiflorum]